MTGNNLHTPLELRSLKYSAQNLYLDDKAWDWQQNGSDWRLSPVVSGADPFGYANIVMINYLKQYLKFQVI
jgi:hypothetical protein